jgi:hypothetical protein
MAKGSAMVEGKAMEREEKKLEGIMVADEKEWWKRGTTTEHRERWQKGKNHE